MERKKQRMWGTETLRTTNSARSDSPPDSKCQKTVIASAQYTQAIFGCHIPNILPPLPCKVSFSLQQSLLSTRSESTSWILITAIGNHDTFYHCYLDFDIEICLVSSWILDHYKWILPGMGEAISGLKMKSFLHCSSKIKISMHVAFWYRK